MGPALRHALLSYPACKFHLQKIYNNSPSLTTPSHLQVPKPCNTGFAISKNAYMRIVPVDHWNRASARLAPAPYVELAAGLIYTYIYTITTHSPVRLAEFMSYNAVFGYRALSVSISHVSSLADLINNRKHFNPAQTYSQ